RDPVAARVSRNDHLSLLDMPTTHPPGRPSGRAPGLPARVTGPGGGEGGVDTVPGGHRRAAAIVPEGVLRAWGGPCRLDGVHPANGPGTDAGGMSAAEPAVADVPVIILVLPAGTQR